MSIENLRKMKQNAQNEIQKLKMQKNNSNRQINIKINTQKKKILNFEQYILQIKN